MRNPYANIPVSMWLLATVTLISRSGYAVLVFLPLFLTKSLGFNIIDAGQIISLYGLGQIIGSYAGGIFTDMFGFLRVQAIGLFLVGILYITLEFLSVKFMLMSCMFFVGIFTASIRPAMGTTIAKFCPPNMRTRAYTLNYQALNLGTSIGPAIGGMLAGLSYAWIFRLDGLANIVAAIAVWLFFHKQSHNRPIETVALDESKSSKKQDAPFLTFLFLVFLIGMCFFQLFNIYPYYLSNSYHLSTFEIGSVMSLNGILIILFQMPVTTLFKKLNSMRIIGVGGALICAGFFILPGYSGFHYALLSMVLITLGEMMVMPFAYEVVTKIAPVKNRGKYLGLLSCALSSIPLLITPNLMPYVYTTFGSGTLWASMGLIGVIVLLGFESLNKTSFGFQVNTVEI